ncbi:TPA: hypothetical protein QDZ84_002892 [Shewanella algae]|uniref:helix-turn-helix domain-containing protein n=1 Tax=Shewanella TaxID=22 RepID=UPI001AAF949D|nr:helix-turn-helix domain-containing protein [Shewanella algae]MBO2580279.1 hypothetical protein [Shewanella algae]HDS1207865.1 hypothetical protein [Shewanella algae]
MNKDPRPKYTGRLRMAGVDAALAEITERSNRSTVLLAQVLFDVARHQGDSPANICERLKGERDNTSVQSQLGKLVKYGWVELVDTQYQNGEYPRKLTFLTPAGAALLKLGK